MRIGLDIDGVITEAPTFFSQLSKLWEDDIYIITYRNDRQSAIDLLKKLDIHYNQLFLVSTFEEKAEIIEKYRITVYWDDQPEMLQNVSEDCSVCLFRNSGNFDFDERKWMFSKKTAKLLF